LFFPCLFGEKLFEFFLFGTSEELQRKVGDAPTPGESHGWHEMYKSLFKSIRLRCVRVVFRLYRRDDRIGCVHFAAIVAR
jgi:hypothetical protein